jgi:hypothetical protein
MGLNSLNGSVDGSGCEEDTGVEFNKHGDPRGHAPVFA